MSNIKVEILEYSYWEHFKALKDIALILPIEHPKRKKLEKAKAISSVAQVIINSAKLEIEYMKACDKTNGLQTVTEFLNVGDDKKKLGV